jgi:hypothetical protein
MTRALIALLVAVTLGSAGSAAGGSGDVLARRKALMSAHPDGRFILALEDELPRFTAAVDEALRCRRARRRGCIGLQDEARGVAQAAATFASGAAVSPGVEPVRITAEAGFRAAVLALSNLTEFDRTGRREALHRAEFQMWEADDLLLGALALAEWIGEQQASGQAQRECPSRAQVQRDVDRFVASERSRGVRVDDVLLTAIVPDRHDGELAYAELRVEPGDDDEHGRSRVVLSYRKLRDSWTLVGTATRRTPWRRGLLWGPPP